MGVTRIKGGVFVFNTQDPSAAFFASDQEWTDFIKGVKNGDFDDLLALAPRVGDHAGGTEGSRSTLDVGADAGLV